MHIKIDNTSNQHFTYLMERYIGLMANSGNVWTLIMITINAMYNTTFTAPEISPVFNQALLYLQK